MDKMFKNYDITVVITHRCNARCRMCNSYENAICAREEISLDDIKKIPNSKFIQITGGEPFMRTDLEEIVDILYRKSKRLMINTNGYFTDELVRICCKYPKLAIRISIDGNKEIHNEIRGIDIYDRAVNSLEEVKKLGVTDLGISFTLQEKNVNQLIDMYRFALKKEVDFGVSVIHNSYYFNKSDNAIKSEDSLKNALKSLVDLQLKSTRKKDWARAYFNDMSINYIDGKPMPVKCDAGVSSFTIECDGNVLPCNMTPMPWVMGNLKMQTWEEIISSEIAETINSKCRNCKLNCWSICNVQSAIKKKIWIPASWLIVNIVKKR
ncbi:radical SAM protein [Butyrivibrio fibrisolvens]|uniref:radical SAM protein n=1 Tax=Butyrivibrio fibrisolvens TaxID=831 RepID=UPI0020BE71F2|nr:radical SAM protein [Butyrivibrio fibrisolvens]